MKTSMNLQLAHQLTLTPQLQQAIRLLQLSSLELQEELKEILAENPFLDNEDVQEPDTPIELKQTLSASTFDATQDTVKPHEESDVIELSDEYSFEGEYQGLTGNRHASNSSDDDYDFEDFYTAEPSLHEYLYRQMQLTPFTETERLMATAIIDAIDEQGMLSLSLEELLAPINATLADDAQLDIEEIEAVLKRVQFYDPQGIAGRDLRECLLLQLQQTSETSPLRDLAIQVVDEHMDWLGQHEIKKLQRHYKLDDVTFNELVKLIRSLNPRPGSQISPTIADYVIPDVFVKKIKNHWVVELNPQSIPKLHLNEHYVGLIQKLADPKQLSTARTQLQEARWFMKSIRSRNETLLRVARSIVKHQLAFFEHGHERLKPLVLNDIALDVSLHESTISRVTTQKYMMTPQGIFELKFFFSSHINTNDGNEFSAKAIQAIIKKLIAQENVRKPLSDDKIAKVLNEQGYQVARRTVAKYRESCSIPASNARKCLV
jgi:RNA polymerase sigma-54 factor